MKYILNIGSLLLIASHLFAQDINVYLRFDDPKLHQSVESFNLYLENASIFSRYEIEPFLKHHPLHLTLYLASYSDAQVDDIKKRVAQIARHWAPIQIKTTGISLTAGNYVMLDVDMQQQPNGQNHPIQQLSDQVVLDLSNIRDFSAPIPPWAESIPAKRKAFVGYGSPNVFFELTPHYSLMAKNFEDPNINTNFRNEMSQLISEYHFSQLLTESSVIGIGYVNSFGQVTEEIAQYPLNGNQAQLPFYEK